MISDKQKEKILIFGGYRIVDNGEKYEDKLLTRCFYPDGGFSYGCPDLDDLNILFDIAKTIPQKCSVGLYIELTTKQPRCIIFDLKNLNTLYKFSCDTLSEALQNALLKIVEEKYAS